MNFADIIRRHAENSPDNIALHFGEQTISYRQLWQQIEVATWTLVKKGVKPGDRVAWLGLNDPQMIVLLFALARLGAILLPLNYRLAPAEMQAILDHAQASLLLADPTHQSTADALKMPATVATAEPDLGVDKPVLLVYTSGTTGKPKGALHTQAGLLANCVASQDAHEFTPNDHILTALPMFHVGGLCIQTLPALHAGARVTLMPRFDAGEWLREVANRRPTMSVLVPATLRAVITHPEFPSADLSSLRLLNAGSSPVPLSLIEAFHQQGVPVCQVYGATETGPVSIYLQRHDAMRKAGSAGRAGVNAAVRLMDPSGVEVAPGQVGEIWLRAPNVMREYWRDPGNSSFQSGWFRTGDLALCDEDGFYWMAGRSKDMIISGGENIYPAELENILADCPQIAEAAVLGMPNERWGEEVVAVVVLQAHATMAEHDVMDLFAGKIARFKQPRRVVFAQTLPKTALGKVLKPELARRLGLESQ